METCNEPINLFWLFASVVVILWYLEENKP